MFCVLIVFTSEFELHYVSHNKAFIAISCFSTHSSTHSPGDRQARSQVCVSSWQESLARLSFTPQSSQLAEHSAGRRHSVFIMVTLSYIYTFAPLLQKCWSSISLTVGRFAVGQHHQSRHGTPTALRSRRQPEARRPDCTVTYFGRLKAVVLC